MRVLDDALRRLRVTSLDLWQLHDIRSMRDVERIFGADGAIHALDEARRQGVVKYLGLTGHYDPNVLLEAMRRFDFDTVLIPLNCADLQRLSFIESVLPAAVERGMGVIAMKVYAGGLLTQERPAERLLRYTLSLPGVSTAIVGCATPAQVDENVRVATEFEPLEPADRRALEMAFRSGDWTSYKRGELVGLG
jgi:aryl-alcohol dehydrogenase-like predicted oxidoreductase